MSMVSSRAGHQHHHLSFANKIQETGVWWHAGDLTVYGLWDSPATVGMKKETMYVDTEECLDTVLDTGLKPDVPGLSIPGINGNIKESGRCMQGSPCSF